MAVFTEISKAQLGELLSHYDIGQAQSLKGIASGIENSNFYLDTDKGKYVLTIFERLNKDQLPYYLELTSHLGKKCLAVSYPIPRKDGGLLSEINGKPCSIAPCLSGTYVEKPSAKACREMGEMLAKMHNAVEDFPLSQENTKGSAFWLSSMPLLKPYIPERLYQMLEKEVNHQLELQRSPEYQALPSGAVHADLFRNNALISVDGNVESLAGVIDFYFACNAPFLYDLAVTLNDWTIDLETGEFEPDRAQAMLEGYNSVRPLTEEDHKLWQDISRLRPFDFGFHDFTITICRDLRRFSPRMIRRISNVFLNFAANPRLKIYLGSKPYLLWKIITFLLKREWTGCEAHVLLSNVRPQLFSAFSAVTYWLYSSPTCRLNFLACPGSARS